MKSVLQPGFYFQSFRKLKFFAVLHMSNNNSAFTSLIADVWERSDKAKKKSDRLRNNLFDCLAMFPLHTMSL